MPESSPSEILLKKVDELIGENHSLKRENARKDHKILLLEQENEILRNQLNAQQIRPEPFTINKKFPH